MKVVYLTWGETPRSYGIFGFQVLSQFVDISKISSGDEFHFVSAVPLIHSGLIREKWSYLKELRKVKETLRGIKFHWITLLTAQNFIYSGKYSFRFLHGGAHKRLKNILASLQPGVVHCRSYHAAWAALQVKKKYRLSYRIIFDGRDLWPETVSLVNGWGQGNRHYLDLLKIERELLAECEVSVSVSDPMHEHYIERGAKNDHLVYLAADCKQLNVDLNDLESSDTVRLCYVGALSEGGWHRPSALVALYQKIRALFPKTILTIVTTSNHRHLKRFFSCLPANEIVFKSAQTTSELKDIFKSQDFGLLSYFVPETAAEKMLADVVLAVKVAEYLAGGLPVIGNAHCGGASVLINKYKLGVTYFPEDWRGINYEALNECLDRTARVRCQEFALNNFSLRVNTMKYWEIYTSLR